MSPKADSWMLGRRRYVRPADNGNFDLNLDDVSLDDWAAVQEITVDATGGKGDGERRKVLRTKFKLADKRGSLELLGSHLKLFTEKIEITGDEALIERLAAGRKRLAK
jgi:phage terminase small subunit